MSIIGKIFLTFMKIGAFSFGGGLAMLPLIEKEIVYRNNWVTPDQFVDIIAISQMTPGPIAINTSTFCGYKVGGLLGALAGSVGVAIVSFCLITILAKHIIKRKDNPSMKAVFKGIRPAVVGLILSAAISVGKTALVDVKSIIICLIIFFMLVRLKIHPILGIIGAAIMGIILY
ncbi:chromate transporter [Lutibacter sp. B2]|nr:chromate transporter [Lutibacter sp. B2]